MQWRVRSRSRLYCCKGHMTVIFATLCKKLQKQQKNFQVQSNRHGTEYKSTHKKKQKIKI